MNLWNPDNLTPSQVGNGWRLLDEDEVPDGGTVRGTQFWQGGPGWSETEDWYGRDGAYKTTLRTQLTKSELVIENFR